MGRFRLLCFPTTSCRRCFQPPFLLCAQGADFEKSDSDNESSAAAVCGCAEYGSKVLLAQLFVLMAAEAVGDVMLGAPAGPLPGIVVYTFTALFEVTSMGALLIIIILLLVAVAV